MKLVICQRFDQDLKRLIKNNRQYQNKVRKTLKLLNINPVHPSLRLHKLGGQNNYSISVDMSVRIIIHFEEEMVFLLRIGRHEQVY